MRLGEQLFGAAAGPLVLRRRFFGRQLHVDASRSNAQRLLFLDGERYIGERELVRGLLTPGMRVVDVGANVGHYALLFASAVGPSGTITCFEPEPDNLRELRRNVAANDLENVVIVAAAAGATNGTIRLRSGINARVTAGGEGDLAAPLVCLDTALTGAVDFLKIDVEGYEGEVLAGARRLLAAQRPALFLEVHPALLTPPHTVDGILAELAGFYPPPALFEVSPQEGLVAKIAARYLRRAVRRVPDPQQLLASCRAGRRAETFWVVARLDNRKVGL